MMTRRQLLLSVLAAPFAQRIAASYVTQEECDAYVAGVLMRSDDQMFTINYITADTFTRAGQRVEVRINGTIHTGVVESVTLHKEEGAMR